jgi:hypothetical protein
MAGGPIRALDSPPTTPFVTRGVYFHDGFEAETRAHPPLHWDGAAWQRQLDWLHACGVNAVEFATMLEFNRRPSTALEHRKIRDRLALLERARRLGMRFGYLLTNTVVSTVPEGEEPGGQLGNRARTLCPSEPGNFERTLENPLFYLEAYREADFFEQFAADWGGCECGRCGVPEYLRYVRVLADRLGELNPRARMYANTWCIAFWRRDPLARGWRDFFEAEIEGTRRVAAALPALPPNVQLAMPAHHLYRPLCFEAYGGRSLTPVFPEAADLERVAAAGREVLAWPHFVMDDDAYRPKAWGIVHLETRYIRDVLCRLRAAGVRHIMGNLYLPYLQLPNTYSFGRLTANPDLEPRAVLEDFARAVAAGPDAATLAEVLVWMDNNSFWQRQMPADGRLENMPCDLNRALAIRLAAGIRARRTPDLPLPLPAGGWLDAVRFSLARMEWAD